ncbi:hypothetical protein SEA_REDWATTLEHOG_167 [Gordonia phage RedWattleHog]|uniref:Uncharacterized protein n=1 Tax=Gordonia phage Stormageddon TaxID=2656541 RepID=A0A649VRU5_9CAUD|nr:hypothetical protein KHQ86_gp132 [Gordonia phage Stormageddon]QGJ95028.1 hypothetical protein SEA_STORMAGEDDON_168 [Gordonia phage Stormageddon]QLF83670.1 hypothetical protein SEA_REDWATTLEHOG_167 [Gordonia phage RedWattleHog]
MRTFRIVLSLPDPKMEFYSRPIVAVDPDSIFVQEAIEAIDRTQQPHGLRVVAIEERVDKGYDHPFDAVSEEWRVV